MKGLELTGIILAGGKSSRMNADKASLVCGDRPLIEIVAAELLQVCSKLIIVRGENNYQITQALSVSDLIPECGPLGGIYTGLTYSKTNYNMIVACDMPKISAPLVRFLAEQAKGYQVVVPCQNGYYEPLAAIYHKNCIPVLAEAMEQGVRKVTACYPKLKVNAIAENALASELGLQNLFVNLNTPQEWELYRRNQINNERK